MNEQWAPAVELHIAMDISSANSHTSQGNAARTVKAKEKAASASRARYTTAGFKSSTTCVPTPTRRSTTTASRWRTCSICNYTTVPSMSNENGDGCPNRYGRLYSGYDDKQYCCRSTHPKNRKQKRQHCNKLTILTNKVLPNTRSSNQVQNYRSKPTLNKSSFWNS